MRVALMDPFHLGPPRDALNECRRAQQELHGHAVSRKGDTLYSARRTLHTGARPAHRTPVGPSRPAVRRR